LGVSILPFAHVYQGGKLIEEMRMSRKYYSTFEKVVQSHIDGSCPLDDELFFTKSPYYNKEKKQTTVEKIAKKSIYNGSKKLP